jgi:hypothetical protein
MNRNKLFFIFVIIFVLFFVNKNQENRGVFAKEELSHKVTFIGSSLDFSYLDAAFNDNDQMMFVFAGKDDNNDINLSLTHCYNSVCSKGKTTHLVDNKTSSIYYVNIFFDNKNRPFFIYNDSGSLKMLKCQDENCKKKDEPILLFDSFSVDKFKVIETKDGLPIISWFSGEGKKTDKLFYSYCSDENCSDFEDNTIELTTIGNSMSIPDIIFNDNKISLVYWDSNVNKLILIKCSDITCKSKATLNVADLSEQVKPFVFIKDDKYYFSYLDYENGNYVNKLSICNDLNCSSITDKVVDDDIGYCFGANIFDKNFLMADSDRNYLDISACTDLTCLTVKHNLGINDAGFGSIKGKELLNIKILEDKNSKPNIIYNDKYGSVYSLQCADKLCSDAYEMEELSFNERELVAPLCKTCDTGDKSKGDANCDEKIDLVDFEIWREESFDISNDDHDWKADFDCIDYGLEQSNFADLDIWYFNYKVY